MILADCVRFWRQTLPTGRLAFSVALIAALVNVLTYVGLNSRGPGAVLFSMHFIVMGLGFALFCLIGFHHLRWSSASLGAMSDESRIPPSLLWLTGGAVAYGIGLFLLMFAVYGEGYPEIGAAGSWVWMRGGEVVRQLSHAETDQFFARELRVFSACWMFFALIISLAWHKLGHRIRQFRNASHGSAA